MLAEEAFTAAGETGMPSGTVQLIYRTDPACGLRLVADPRLGATGFTGSRSAGMRLKMAADAVGLLDAFNQSRIIASNEFNLSAVTGVGIAFVIITIPTARLVDRLTARDARRREGSAR